LGSSKEILNRYFGDTLRITVSRQIQVLCLPCFCIL
jgi:hypothetical protein